MDDSGQSLKPKSLIQFFFPNIRDLLVLVLDIQMYYQILSYQIFVKFYRNLNLNTGKIAKLLLRWEKFFETGHLNFLLLIVKIKPIVGNLSGCKS